ITRGNGCTKPLNALDAKLAYIPCSAWLWRYFSVDDSVDIRANAPFPGGALSNFAPHPFVLDGVACACMEGFLQSLKVQAVSEQLLLCGLAGPIAKSIGSELDWRVSGTLWWHGTPMDRLSNEYQKLLDRAYDALFAQSPVFRAALVATGNAQLTH